MGSAFGRAGGTGCPAHTFAEASQRSSEILRQPPIRQSERGAAPDHHIVAAGVEASRGRKPHNFPQLPAYPVTLDGAAYLLGNREADPDRTAIVALALLQDKTCRRGGGPGGSGDEIFPLPQSFHCTDIWKPARRPVTH